MASTSTPPADYGSWTQYGWKVGPAPVSTNRPETLAYGPGVQYTPTFTYAFAPGVNNANNIVSNVTPTSGEASFMPLITTPVIGDQVAQPYYGSPFVPYGNLPSEVPQQKNQIGYLAVQLQYPCTLIMQTGIAPTTDVVWTVFGYDWYMQPMQEMITLVNGDLLAAGNKAFYGITGVWFNGEAISITSPMALMTSNTYGLPYALADLSHVIQYGEQLGTPTLPPQLNTAVITAANNNPIINNGTGPDVRGTFTLDGGFDPDGTSVVSITYFVQGASPWKSMMSKISAGGNPSGQEWVYPVDHPDADALYGISQYYTKGYAST